MPDENDVYPEEDLPPLPAPIADPEESAIVLSEAIEPERPARTLRPPHPGFWWALLWCLGIVVVLLLLPNILGLVILLANSPKALAADPKVLINSQVYAQAVLWSTVVSEVLSVALALLVIRLIVGREWPRILALRWPGWSHLLLALLGWPALSVIVTGIDHLASRTLPSITSLEEVMALIGKWPLPLALLVVGLGPGIGEELWCRGFFGRGLVGRYGVVAGVLLTSLLFGLIHVEPRQVVYASFMGVLLHLSYLASRSLLIPVFVHAVNNSLSVLALHNPALQALDLPAATIPWYLYGAAILALAAVGWAFWKTRVIFVDLPATEGPIWRPAFAGVAHPPPESATRVLRRAPDTWTWLVVLAGLAAFIGAVVLVATRV